MTLDLPTLIRERRALLEEVDKLKKQLDKAKLKIKRIEAGGGALNSVSKTDVTTGRVVDRFVSTMSAAKEANIPYTTFIRNLKSERIMNGFIYKSISTIKECVACGELKEKRQFPKAPPTYEKSRNKCSKCLRKGL